MFLCMLFATYILKYDLSIEPEINFLCKIDVFDTEQICFQVGWSTVDIFILFD